MIYRQDAQYIVRTAIIRGELIRPDRCSECDKECKPHAHHEDYQKPLEVIFLCPKCHNRRHIKDRIPYRKRLKT